MADCSEFVGEAGGVEVAGGALGGGGRVLFFRKLFSHSVKFLFNYLWVRCR